MIILNFDATRFKLNGVVLPKTYRGRAFGSDKIAIINIYNNQELSEPELISNISIDGIVYATILEALNALNSVTYSGVGGAVSISDEAGTPIGKSNPLSFTDFDNNLRMSRNTVFGDKITAKRVPQIASQYQYPIAADCFTATPVNGGTVIQENSLLKVKTAAVVGSKMTVRSNKTIRYIPGFECYAYITPVFNTPIAGQNQFTGVLDTDTGFGFGYEGLDFVFIYRRNGVTQTFPIDLAAFQAENGYALDPTKGNIYLITYGYLGFAPCKLEVVPPAGGLAKLYSFEYPNSSVQTHLSQTFLPICFEADNGATDTAMNLSVGSVLAGIIDGSQESTYTFARAFNYFSPEITIAANTVMVAFRNKTTFGGIVNYVNARLMNLNVGIDLTKTSTLVIFKNPVVTNTPTWVDVDVDSTLERSMNMTINFTTSLNSFFAIPLAKLATIDKNVEPFAFDLIPGDIACFAIITTGAGEAKMSNLWKELF